jgi:hypothetical protein
MGSRLRRFADHTRTALGRGRANALDRKKLERASCECYKATKTLFAAAIGPPAAA